MKQSSKFSDPKRRQPPDEGVAKEAKRDEHGGRSGGGGRSGPTAGEGGWLARIPFLGGLFGRTSGK